MVSRVVTPIWLAAWIGAFILTHLPKLPGGPGRIPHLDKVAHFAVFFAITYLGGIRVLRLSKRTDLTLLAWLFVYLTYAGIDELTQPLTGRECNLADWVFDALGVLLATILIWKRALPSWIQGSAERVNVTNN